MELRTYQAYFCFDIYSTIEERDDFPRVTFMGSGDELPFHLFEKVHPLGECCVQNVVNGDGTPWVPIGSE